MTVNRRPLLLGHYAGVISRAAALVIDVVIVSVTVVVVNWIISLPLSYFFSLDVQSCLLTDDQRAAFIAYLCRGISALWVAVIIITAPLYFAALTSLNGQTIGKYIMGLRVVRFDGERMTFWRSLLRWFGYFVSALPFFLGYFVVLVDDRRRTLHDRMAGTCVIYSWRARRNELLVTQVGRWFDRDDGENDVSGDRPQPARPFKLTSIYELVVIAIPNYAQLQTMLMLLDSSVRSEDIKVVNSAVMVKGMDGQMGVVAIDNLITGIDNLGMVDIALSLPEAQLEQIRADVPADSFVIVLLIRDRWLDATLRIVSRRTPAMLAHYDVGDHPETLTTDDGLHPDVVSVPQ